MIRQLEALALLAVAIGLGSPAVAQSIKPDIVGQIIDISPASSRAVHVSERGRPVSTAKPYQPLYPGDVVTVSARGVSATVLLAGTDDSGTTLTNASPPFVAPSSGTTPTNLSLFAAMVKYYDFILHPSPAPSVVSTTPRSLQFHASPYLPATPQTIRAGVAQELPVVWRGSPGAVWITDSAGKTLAMARSRLATFVIVPCPALPRGPYNLHIGSLDIPIVAADDQPPNGTPIDLALAAATKLHDEPGDALQSLADLRRLSATVYLARALIRGVASSP